MRIFATGWSDDVDGPGRRLVVYLKGCNFRCRWCANPEGMSAAPEMLFYPARSAFAQASCPRGAVRDGRLDRTRCAACPDRPCVRLARDPAFEFAGAELSTEALLARAEAARPLLAEQGGVTFAGGEPTAQADEVLAAAQALRGMRIHTAIETNAGTPGFAQFPGQVDLIIADVKCVSPDRHREYVGADNALVAGNLAAAAARQGDLLIRVTLVTGFNDGEDEQARLAELLGRLRQGRDRLRAQVLRLHHVGECKYAALGIEYPMKGAPHPAEQRARELESRLAAAGLTVEPPWSTKK
ncbi:MAG: glycyl-radical enzyme activating protein [Planctomycetota bacterium]|nr:glycyl-radical enzyme activating protein [Planctomycetota bacterium]